jgi:SAM-dependent methyltransferase
MTRLSQQRSWDAVAASYQANHAPGAAIVHYGPLAPPEAELRLLGDLCGLHILDLGCGGGQCSVAFARQGATVTGVDFSREQLRFARTRMAQAGVTVDLRLADATDLAGFADEGWDLVFAAAVLHYVTPLAACLAECWRVLRPQGRLVFSVDHPVRNAFFDEEEQELAPYAARSYFERRPLRWQFPGVGAPMTHYHYTTAEWIDLLAQAGFQLARLVEPETPVAVAAAEWPEGDPLFSMRNLPHTAIFVATKQMHRPNAASGELVATDFSDSHRCDRG